MAIRADLLIDGQKYFPGYRESKTGEIEKMDQKISGPDTTVSIIALNEDHKIVKIFITPDKNSVIPPDFVTLEISHKRLIWVVWLGTLLIAAGFVISMARLRKNA